MVHIFLEAEDYVLKKKCRFHVMATFQFIFGADGCKMLCLERREGPLQRHLFNPQKLVDCMLIVLVVSQGLNYFCICIDILQ